MGAVEAVAGDTHGFPRIRTSFVGRDAEVAEVAGLLAQHQLVTVTGPGGVGKTRLAFEVARRAAAGFADGAWLVELAAVQDPARVPDTVAMVLGIQSEAGEPLPDVLVAALSRRQLLVVLDNCEHVLGAAAELCERLLAVADDVRVLTTSREPLGLTDEVRYRLPPLPVPEPGQDAGPDGSAAVRLFTDRARQADPRLDISGEAGSQVARLVTRLDGMPLAIELAAARVEALGLSQLLSRLEDGFRLLASGRRSAHERHRSLEAMVRWSYELLAEPERKAFRQLAVFPGGFTLEAAVTVAGDQAELAVLRLVDCSLLTPPRAGSDGRSRYLMLETLRDFARDELKRSGEHAAAEGALARDAADTAEQAAVAMAGHSTEGAGVRWLDAEYATAQHALRWCLEHDPATALRLALALAPWLRRRGHEAERYNLLSAAIGEGETGSESWCAAQCQLGEAAANLNDLAGALAHYTEARDGSVAGRPSPLLADAIVGRAIALVDLGRTAEGAEEARQVLKLSRDIAYPEGQAGGLYCLSMAALHTDRAAEAVEWAMQAARIDPETYQSDMARGLQRFLAEVLMRAGDYEAAREQCARVQAAARDVGDLKEEVYCGSVMADIELRSGNLASAWTRLRPALDAAKRISHRVTLLGCLWVGGDLCEMAGRWDEAVTVHAALGALNRAAGQALSPATAQRREAVLHRAAQALGPERTRAAEGRGMALSLETAIEYLLLVTENGPGDGRATEGKAAAPGPPPLSARERELVTLVARGMTDAQISGQLFISVSTVRSHLDRIRDKTGSRRRADLTRLALHAGLV